MKHPLLLTLLARHTPRPEVPSTAAHRSVARGTLGRGAAACALGAWALLIICAPRFVLAPVALLAALGAIITVLFVPVLVLAVMCSARTDLPKRPGAPPRHVRSLRCVRAFARESATMPYPARIHIVEEERRVLLLKFPPVAAAGSDPAAGSVETKPPGSTHHDPKRHAMKHRISLLMVLGCIGLGACDRPDPADPAIDPAFARNATNLPFKAEFSGTSTPVGMCPGGVFFLTTGSGRGTHVGAATMSMDVCMDMATMLPLGPMISILVAANGDTLLTALTGGGTDPVTGDTESEWAIMGGTGRFVGAQGQFTNRGRHNPDFSWYARSDGWISLRQ